MRKFAIAGALLLAIAGAATYGVFIEPTREMKARLNEAIAALPPGYIAEYGDAHYSVLTGVATVTAIRIHVPNAIGGDYEIAEISAEHPNLGFADAWKQAAANPAAWAEDSALPVADRIVVKDVSLRSSLVNGTLADATMDKPRVYPWALLHPGLPALDTVASIYRDATRLQEEAAKLRAKQTQASLAQDDDAQQVGGDDPGKALEQGKALQLQALQKLTPLLRLEAAVLLGVGLDNADLTGVAYRIDHPALEGQQAGEWRFAVQRIHESGLDRGNVEEISADDIREDFAPLATFSARRLSEQKIMLRGLARKLMGDEPLSAALLDGTSIGRLEALDIHLLPSGSKGKGADIHGVSLSDIAFDHGLPVSFAFQIDAAKIPHDALQDATSQQLFNKLSLYSATLDFGFAYKWDTGRSIAKIQKVMLRVHELGALALSAEITGFTPGKPAAESAPALAAAEIRYDDATQVNRLVGGETHALPQSLKIRQGYAEQFIGTVGLDQNDPKMAPSVQAIMAFAKKPQSLTMTAAPVSPVSFADLQAAVAGGPASLFKALAVSITANQ
jgi:hypothetical protein